MKQPKLPRKRKKQYIKSVSRVSYRHTVYLAYVTGESPCKFWKTVVNTIETIEGTPIPMPTATSYW